MYFTKYLLAISDVLDIKFHSMEREFQNPSDKGELCELFIQEAISVILENITDSFRGGKIINIDNKESKQIDIILTSKNSLKLFSDKSIYPIETVKSAISVTANLNFQKLTSVIDEFKSIPKANQRFHYDLIDSSAHENILRERLPYKFVFGYAGDININWEKYLNKIVENDKNSKEYLPDLIVVNKKGVIEKVYDKNSLDIDGAVIGKDFLYTNYALYKNYGSFLVSLLHEIEKLSSWDTFVRIKYMDYFNYEIDVEKETFRK